MVNFQTVSQTKLDTIITTVIKTSKAASPTHRDVHVVERAAPALDGKAYTSNPYYADATSAGVLTPVEWLYKGRNGTTERKDM